MKYLITGASGHLGRLAAAEALTRVAPQDLILTTRTTESLADFAAKGAEVRYADFNDPDGLVAAFSGAERLLLISTADIGHRAPQHKAAIDAAVKAGVKFIAYTSFANPVPENPLFVVAEHIVAEQDIRDSGLGWSFLRNWPYADQENRPLAFALGTGKLVVNTGEGKTAYVSRADCAAVAAAVLTGEGHADTTYDIVGPEEIDADRRAAIFSEVSGKPLVVEQVDDDTFGKGMSDISGLPFEITQKIATGIGKATRGGFFEGSSAAIEDLISRPALTLQEVLEEQKRNGELLPPPPALSEA